jgi:hypothetical protein
VSPKSLSDEVLKYLCQRDLPDYVYDKIQDMLLKGAKELVVQERERCRGIAKTHGAYKVAEAMLEVEEEEEEEEDA